MCLFHFLHKGTVIDATLLSVCTIESNSRQLSVVYRLKGRESSMTWFRFRLCLSVFQLGFLNIYTYIWGTWGSTLGRNNFESRKLLLDGNCFVLTDSETRVLAPHVNISKRSSDWIWKGFAVLHLKSPRCWLRFPRIISRTEAFAGEKWWISGCLCAESWASLRRPWGDKATY